MVSGPEDTKTPSILFVCYGNVCRSPMAEGLAKHLIGKKTKIQSAGLSPVLKGAAPEAIETLRNLYAIDISRHRARSITDITLGVFDHIIILDVYVFETLKNRFPSDAEKLTLWDIEDPFGRDMNAYRKAAEKIKKRIEKQLVPLYNP